jgi:predicted nucleic acid-binding protein
VILVDTSVLVGYLRGRETDATGRLDRLELEDSPWAIPVPCVQEILQGALDEREWRSLHMAVRGRDIVEPVGGVDAHVAAARIWFDARRRGLTIRSATDCLIAQIALDHDAFLLHDDDDFERIAKVRPLKTLRR